MRYLSLTAFIAALLVSCSPNGPAESASSLRDYQNVDIAIIQRDSISIPVFSVGTLSSKTQSKLSFLTGGIIKQFSVSEGDPVKEGDLLAKLDITEIESRVKQASLAFEKAERDFKRAENLYQDTVI